MLPASGRTLALHAADQRDECLRCRQSAFIEKFNGRLRDKFLNDTHFSSLHQARAMLAEWQIDYDTARPHSALGRSVAPAFAATLHPRRTPLAVSKMFGDAPKPAYV
ncbi:hypothetical protein Sa4125_11730 [Aureimonas sp. SA4125]|nr:hypothetical protein Sa4125_11730 [Aureimonas sp. SA4125]